MVAKYALHCVWCVSGHNQSKSGEWWVEVLSRVRSQALSLMPPSWELWGWVAWGPLRVKKQALPPHAPLKGALRGCEWRLEVLLASETKHSFLMLPSWGLWRVWVVAWDPLRVRSQGLPSSCFPHRGFEGVWMVTWGSLKSQESETKLSPYMPPHRALIWGGMSGCLRSSYSQSQLLPLMPPHGDFEMGVSSGLRPSQSQKLSSPPHAPRSPHEPDTYNIVYGDTPDQVSLPLSLSVNVVPSYSPSPQSHDLLFLWMSGYATDTHQHGKQNNNESCSPCRVSRKLLTVYETVLHAASTWYAHYVLLTCYFVPSIMMSAPSIKLCEICKL